MRTLLLTLSCALACVAAPITFNTTLTPGKEVPPPNVAGASPAGTASFVFDPAAATLSGLLTWSGMTTTVTDAHLHNAAPGVAGPVIFPIFSGQSFPTTSSFTLPSTALTPTQVTSISTALASGTLYANIHTVRNPSGEIRGDVPAPAAAVPEPSSAILLFAGIAGAYGWKRIKRS